MKLIKTSLMVCFTLMFLCVGAHAEENDRFTRTIDLFLQSDAVKPFFDDAYGFAVFPSVGKGGVVIGGAYGAGRVYVKERITGTTTLTKLSVGFQLGGQAFREIIFFKDKRAYDEFTAENFEFDGSVSAVIVTAGAQAQASTAGSSAGASLGPATGTQAETDYTKGMAVFVHPLGGLMLEVSIGGQKFTFEPIN